MKIVATICIDFSSKCTKMRLAAGLRPDPLGELKRSPRSPSPNKGGLLLRGGEGRGGGEGEKGRGKGEGKGGRARGKGPKCVWRPLNSETRNLLFSETSSHPQIPEVNKIEMSAILGSSE